MALEELHELDPIRGLPELLPEGEVILWQGSPQWWSLCRRAFHVGLVLAYFAALALWQLVAEPLGDQSMLLAALIPLLLAVPACGLLMLIAHLIVRTTVYTITNQRVVMQFGIALPLNLNLPFTQILGVGHKQYRDGSGDLPIELAGDDVRVAYALLWPHGRPWHLRKPQPMLRAVADSAAVAGVLADALRAAGHVDDSGAAKAAAAAGVQSAAAPG